MKTHIWILLSIVLLVALSCQKNKSAQEEESKSVITQPDIEADKQALTKFNEEWDVNAMAGDFKKNAYKYTEDAIRIDGGKIYEGREAISDLLQSYVEDYVSLTNENKIEKMWISGDVAAVKGSFKGSVVQKESGDTLHLKGAWADVFERQPDGKWKMVYSIGAELK